MAVGAGSRRRARQRARRSPRERCNRRLATPVLTVDSHPMRQIVLDTETTGLEPELNHRVIEIGCVELVNRRSTWPNFPRYLYPERDHDDTALLCHGNSRTPHDHVPHMRGHRE